MPGIYLEYIKAGQYVVPIEISFLSIPLKDETGKEVGQTSKWAEKNHWKEIKALLKPAVEAALKYNEQPVDKVSKSSHVAFGQEIGLGYVLGTSKEKSPFLAVLDMKKNCWTDDEEDDAEANENTRLRDYGGKFKNYTPTKVYISSAIIRRTASQTEDGKRLRKQLGSINEDVRSYFQPSNNASVLQIPSGVDTTPITTIDKVNLLLGLSDSANRKPGSINLALYQLHENSAGNKDATTNNSSDSNSDFLGKKKTSEDHYDEEIRKWRYDRKTIPNKNDSFWSNLNVEGSYYEERDEEADDDVDSTRGQDKGLHGLGPEHNMQDIYDLDFDDDTFSLPDIDTPLRTKPNEISSFATNTFNTFGKMKMKTTPPSRNLTPNTPSTPMHLEKKKSPKKTSHLSRSFRRGSSDDNDVLNEYDALLYDEMRPAKKKGKRTNSVKHNASITSITSDSYSAVSGNGAFEGAIRAFEPRNQLAPPLSSKNWDSIGSSFGESYITPAPRQKSPERKKGKEPGHIIKNFKKSPTISPPRMQKFPSVSKVCSPVHKSSSPTKPSKGSGSPHVRTIFPSSSTSPDITASPLLRKENRSEVQIISVKPKRIRKTMVAKFTPPSAVMSSPSKYTLTQIMNIKKEHGSRKESSNTQASQQPNLTPTTEELTNENVEIDPEMPILERMVFAVPPSIEPIHAVKAEPLATSQSQPATPSKKKCKVLKSKVTGKSSPISKKNEATETVVSKTANKAKARAVKNLRTPTKSKLKTSNVVARAASHLATSTPMPVPPETPSVIQESPEPLQGAFRDRTSTGMQKNSSSGSDGSDDLFSFENLDKSPPKFSGPSVPLTTSGGTQKGSMMSPPAKRPPRTLNKNVAPAAVTKKPAAGFGIGTRPQLSTVATQVNPTQLSTFDLLSNPNLLRAGMGLLTKFNANKLNSAELDKRIGLQDARNPPATAAPPRPVRPASPDICEGPPRAPKDESQLMPAPPRSVRGRRRAVSLIGGNVGISDALLRKLDGPDAPARSDRDSAEDDSYLSDSEAQEDGEALVRELMNRYNSRGPSIYEPEGDEFDMSQRSYCMMNIVPDYQQKSRLFKIHSKNIAALTRQNIVDQFQAIIPDMVAVFQGAGKSVRHKMYLQGKLGRDRLKEMIVSIPFNNDHGMTLITLLFEYFVPDVTARQHWTDYINYVMLPESFIRIYARVNDLSYDMAETEMRYGACYDDPNPGQLV